MSTGFWIVPERPIWTSPTWPPCASEAACALELPTGCSGVAVALEIHEYETNPMAITMTTACVASRTSRNKERYPPVQRAPVRGGSPPAALLGVPLLCLRQGSRSIP